MNLNQVLFEGDAKQVVNGVNGSNDDFPWKGQLIDDIKVLFSAYAGWKLCFTKRCINQATHTTTKLGIRLENEVVWIEDGPRDVMPVVQLDKACIT